MRQRFWYDTYSSTTEDLLEHVQDIADEQGSASAKVVFEDYLTDERKRELRREFMREELSAAFATELIRVDGKIWFTPIQKVTGLNFDQPTCGFAYIAADMVARSRPEGV